MVVVRAVPGREAGKADAARVSCARPRRWRLPVAAVHSFWSLLAEFEALGCASASWVRLLGSLGPPLFFSAGGRVQLRPPSSPCLSFRNRLRLPHVFLNVPSLHLFSCPSPFCLMPAALPRCRSRKGRFAFPSLPSPRWQHDLPAACRPLLGAWQAWWLLAGWVPCIAACAWLAGSVHGVRMAGWHCATL